ncbi:hypothetical protein REPUB_Repub20aG0023300 [Reevesia pubescens]
MESQSTLVRRDALSLDEHVGGGGQVLHVGGAALLIGGPEEAVTRRDVVGADHPDNVGLELWERQIFCQNELELALVNAPSPISRGSTGTFPDDSGLLNEGSLCVDLSSFGPLPCFPANFLSVETDSCTPIISVLPHNRGEKKELGNLITAWCCPKKKGESKSPRQRTRLTRKSRDLRDEINEAMLCHSTDFGFDSFSSGSELEEDGCLEGLDNEAEEVWRISEALGIRFKASKDKVIEVLCNLERDDRSKMRD